MNTTDFIARQGNLFEGVGNVSEAVFAMTKGNIGTARPATAEQIAEELSKPELKAAVEQVRAETDEARQKALKEEKKFEIIGLCPHYYQFRNNHRAAADALAECCTYKTTVDVDEREYGQQAIEGALRLNQQPGVWRDKVLYIENSLRGGGKCHIWLKMPVGMTAVETQQAFCEALNIPCDDAVQQKQSFILMTGDAVYQSPAFLQPLSQEEIEARQTAFRLRGLSIDGWDKVTATDEHGNTPSATDAYGKTRKGNEVPVTMPSDADIAEPTPRTDFLFDRHYRMTGLPQDHIKTDGKCHNTLKSLFSTGICALLTKAEMQGQLRKRTPDYWQCKDCQRLINDFYAKYNDPARALTREQRQILAASEHIGEKGIALNPDDKGTQEQPVCDELTLSEIYASPVPPRLNRKMMPRLVKAVTSRTPDENVECVAQACFPSLQSHPVGLKAKYIDNRPRELRNGCVTVVETGVGKSCVDLPIKHIMADTKEVTDRERKAEEQFHQQYNAASQDKPLRRKFKIRNLMPDLTRPALVMRCADNDGAPLYCKMNEIEQWDKVEQASGKANSFTIMKLNDDEGNDFGAERAGTQSVTASTSLFLNWNASTTPGKLIRYMRHAVNDGPVSRITMATIPDPGIGSDIPTFGDYDKRYDESLKPFIDNLNAATGLIDCPQARKLIKELKAECDAFAVASGDRVFDNLTHRALVHVFRKAISIFCANGMKWENTKVMKSFLRWSLHYDIHLKLHFFGDLIRQAEADVATSKHGPRNMLLLLPDEFTATDLSNVRFAQGKDREGTRNQISQWLHRKYILRLTDDRYQKGDYILQYPKIRDNPNR